MATRPSNFPEWATLDQIDPVSGSNNSLQPPPQKALYGFARLEFAPRNWFNWLFKTINEWIEYFDAKFSQTVVVDGSGTDAIVDVTVGGMVEISVIDTDSSSATNFYTGIVYVPPGYSSGTLNFNTIASSVLTVSAITALGKVTIGGGTGPYIVKATTSNI